MKRVRRKRKTEMSKTKEKKRKRILRRRRNKRDSISKQLLSPPTYENKKIRQVDIQQTCASHQCIMCISQPRKNIYKDRMNCLEKGKSKRTGTMTSSLWFLGALCDKAFALSSNFSIKSLRSERSISESHSKKKKKQKSKQ